MLRYDVFNCAGVT